MHEKMLFKASSTSYSQFLQSKEPHIHCLSAPTDASVGIEFFRRSVSLHYQHVYATKKWQNWLYRFIFFSFGILFLVLGTIIFFKTANFACGFYFSNCAIVKNCINITCLLLACGAFAFGYKIHPEKEAIRYLVGKVERELNSPAKQLQIEFNAIFANLSHEWMAPQQTIWIKKFKTQV
jgi:uncharacterized membrane protein YbhN (UPF0104 family)